MTNEFAKFTLHRAQLINSPRYFLRNQLIVRLRRLSAAGKSLDDIFTLAHLESYLRANHVEPQLVASAAGLWDGFAAWTGTARKLHRNEAAGVER